MSSWPVVERSSSLPADPQTVWQHATSLAGINHELAPWIRMSSPEGITSLVDANPPIGEPWFAAPVWFLGVLPYDRMQLKVVELDRPGRRFVEESSMIWLRSWRHERFVLPAAEGCVITDRLTPIPRVPGMGPVVRAMVGALFDHRHRRLRAHFRG